MMNFSTPIRLTKFPGLTGTGQKPIIQWSGLCRLESYVQLALPQITTFLLLVHMAIGCCMHHTHACETDCCSEPTATAEACPCGTHRFDDVAEAPLNGPGHFTERGGHGDRHQCGGDHCTFVQSQSAPEEFDEHSADCCILDLVDSNSSVDLSFFHLDRSLDQPHSFAGNSLRTHLALRVLLI